MQQITLFNRLFCRRHIRQTMALFLIITGLLINSINIHSQNLSDKAQSQADKIMAMLKQSSEDIWQFQVQAKLLSYNPGTGENIKTELLIYADRNKGKTKSLAKVLAPERSEGQIFLNNINVYWVFYPKLQRSLALSPLSTLAGDVSIGDILAPPPLQIYKPKVLESDGKKLVLELIKMVRNAPYTKVIQYYEGDILKNAEFYGGQSGKILMKRAQYLKPIKNRDDYFYTQVKILNELQKGRYTIIAFSQPRDIKIPTAWFNPNNLTKVP